MPSEQPDLPQLDMRFNRFDNLPEVGLPEVLSALHVPGTG